MASLSKLSLSKVLHDKLEPHVFETFDSDEDYNAFQRHIILPIICGSHDHQYIYYTDKPALPLLVSFAPTQCSIESVYRLILETNINSSSCIPFLHCIDYPPQQSASISIPCHFIAHGFFSPNIPGCFMSEDKKLYLKGDIVALGVDGPQEAVVEGVKEVGRYFLMFEIQEVGTIPIGCIQTTQLVVPLISHPLTFLHSLVVIVMAIFPCFFQYSTVFGKLGEVSKKEDKLQSQFSDPVSMAYVLNRTFIK
jgi:hypothetical protein